MSIFNFNKNQNLNNHYKINNQWNKELDRPYDNFEMIIFDNYPNSNKDWDYFLKIVNESKELEIPTIFISGLDQDYKILSRIKDLYPITFLKQSVEQRLKANKNYTEDYDLSDFYKTVAGFHLLANCFQYPSLPRYIFQILYL